MDKSKLEKFNSNIIKWYPFEENKTIIQVGINKNITRELEKIFKEVRVISNKEKQEIMEKFDYILIYAYEKNYDILLQAIRLMKESSKILVIGKNETGINEWSKYCNDDNNGILELENHHKRKKSIKAIKDQLCNYNLDKINTFYSFPDYEHSEIIISEDYKIEKSNLEKYNPSISENDVKIFDEIKVLKTVVDTRPEMIDFFANSYFIEASKEKIENDIKYVSFNNCRKQQYQLITMLKENVVEKIPANEESEKHIENMAKIIDEINKDGIEILDYVKDGKLYSKLVKNQKTLDRVLADNSDSIDTIVEILNKLRAIINNISVSYVECKDCINIKDDEEIFKKLRYMKYGYWDMISKNCFYIDNKFIFFDQEWEKNYLPVEFILYRSIINSYDLVRKIDINEVLEKLNILEYKQYFEKIDIELRKEIIDEEIFREMYVKDDLKAVDNLINENKTYIEENSKKDQYIKVLENKIQDLNEDNSKKQEYISALEEIVRKETKRKI